MIKNSLYIYVLLLAFLVPGTSVADVDICSCVNEPIKTDEKAKACRKLLDGMTPKETVKAKGDCNAKLARKKGLDVCFCLKALHTDPDIVKACEAIIGKKTKPSEMARLAANCSKKK